jgi:hypothetical protein
MQGDVKLGGRGGVGSTRPKKLRMGLIVVSCVACRESSGVDASVLAAI